jgi:AAA domain
VKPVRTALVDLENSARELRRRLRPMRAKLGKRLEPETLFVYSRPEGLDLGDSDEDREWLRARLRRTRAELLCIGPAYKMAGGDPNSEQDMKPVAAFLDELRAEFGVAIIVEAHLTHGGDGGRPYGWSGWRRWPEIGLELKESGQLVHWRTPRHETPAIPPALMRGGAWPFEVAKRPRDVLWASIVDHCSSALTRPTVRQLASVFGVGNASIQRALDEHREEWERLFDE